MVHTLLLQTASMRVVFSSLPKTKNQVSSKLWHHTTLATKHQVGKGRKREKKRKKMREERKSGKQKRKSGRERREKMRKKR